MDEKTFKSLVKNIQNRERRTPRSVTFASKGQIRKTKHTRSLGSAFRRMLPNAETPVRLQGPQSLRGIDKEIPDSNKPKSYRQNPKMIPYMPKARRPLPSDGSYRIDQI